MRRPAHGLRLAYQIARRGNRFHRRAAYIRSFLRECVSRGIVV